jgi:hypothetical protein
MHKAAGACCRRTFRCPNSLHELIARISIDADDFAVFDEQAVSV